MLKNIFGKLWNLIQLIFSYFFDNPFLIFNLMFLSFSNTNIVFSCIVCFKYSIFYTSGINNTTTTMSCGNHEGGGKWRRRQLTSHDFCWA